MTCREKLAIEYPECLNKNLIAGCEGCPSTYGYLPDPISTEDVAGGCYLTCNQCWDREIPGTEIQPKHPDSIRPSINHSYTEKAKLDKAIDNVLNIGPTIKDSGDRTEFASGAVRDMHEGKGRCDLLPLDVVSEWLINDHVLDCIYDFTIYGTTPYLFGALNYFRTVRDWDIHTTNLEVAKHFEEGAKKYGDNNWRKGIPARCYIDSAVRHYLKYLRGDKDEPHDRAFCWNILCCIWTCKHKPEWNDYAKKEDKSE